MLRVVHERRASALSRLAPLLIILAGCPAGAEPVKARALEPAATAAGAKSASQPDAKPDAKPDTKSPDTKSPDAKADATPEVALGRVLEGPLPIAGLLGKPPAEVQAQLSEPLGKGMRRKSCVRFLPERTWFECEFATQRYGDTSGAYSAIGVEYQNGKSTAVAFEGPKHPTGAFDVRAALAYVGLELPGEPKIETPPGDALVASWFNAAARLRIDGRQYRVVVSSVGNDWSRTKVEVSLNDPLDADELARVMVRPSDDQPQ